MSRSMFRPLCAVFLVFACSQAQPTRTETQGRTTSKPVTQSGDAQKDEQDQNMIPAVTGLKAELSGRTVKLSWNPQNGVSLYRITWKSPSSDKIQAADSSTSTYQSAELEPGSYQFQVQAVHDAHESQATSISITVPGASPGMPPPPAAAVFSLTSPAFQNMQPIPMQYVAKNGGGNQSPPLQWKSAPAGTGSFAIQMVDLDFRVPPFIHWVIFNIPANSTQLPAAIPAGNNLAQPPEAQGASQTSAYRGPNPPNLHRYEFTIYAVKAGETLNLGADSATNRAELEAKSLAKASLIGTYQ